MSLLLETGIYSIPEAARLTRVSSRRIRGWLTGYALRTKAGTRHSAAVWQGQLPPIDGKLALGFLDLLEVRCLDALLSTGISWRFLRQAHGKARTLLGHDHPFCTSRFATDGRTIFLETREQSRGTCLWDITDLQRVFDKIIQPFLMDVEYGAEQAPLRWWPRGREHRVVIDPRRNLGQPTIGTVGIPTRVLAAAVTANGSVAGVARWFEVPAAVVTEAVKYESSLNA
ncbi:MAG: hypothetical protein A3K19_01310 [Lentisphaerae bacterium RIFOXYB12_FULL_65_16]|nr:MAG: hypothetical protein A3K18_06190 [Lentisphaerae bacterium RIFOXYA12_64_32]OGV92535.1 MAG: hypothetical protein A3K19_01310 [Lentisphaerae bacterium RIFOXYB12_FULL_65_16]